MAGTERPWTARARSEDSGVVSPYTENQKFGLLTTNIKSFTRRSFASLRPQHTGHPEPRRSFASLRPRHTGHPGHKKGRLYKRPL